MRVARWGSHEPTESPLGSYFRPLHKRARARAGHDRRSGRSGRDHPCHAPEILDGRSRRPYLLAWLHERPPAADAVSFILRFWPYLAGIALLILGAWRIHHAGYESGYAASEVQWQTRFAVAERVRDAANLVALQKEADSNALTQKAEA